MAVVQIFSSLRPLKQIFHHRIYNVLSKILVRSPFYGLF